MAVLAEDGDGEGEYCRSQFRRRNSFCDVLCSKDGVRSSKVTGMVGEANDKCSLDEGVV